MFQMVVNSHNRSQRDKFIRTKIKIFVSIFQDNKIPEDNECCACLSDYHLIIIRFYY